MRSGSQFGRKANTCWCVTDPNQLNLESCIVFLFTCTQGLNIMSARNIMKLTVNVLKQLRVQ
uniref:Uncharacterized protein n=1 Tax=Anguilla anguilla TaxID=7936 RepID=A0A0E9RNV0_ANGAN